VEEDEKKVRGEDRLEGEGIRRRRKIRGGAGRRRKGRKGVSEKDKMTRRRKGKEERGS
jgi:hypothetical protein